MKSYLARLIVLLRGVCISASVAFGTVAAIPGEALAQSGCDTLNFDAGTRWDVCWRVDAFHGLVMSNGRYTDRGGTTRTVLFQGSIAEVHVPYHAGQPRFLDVTVNSHGLGTDVILLKVEECEGGVLLASSRVCRQVEDRGYAWKFTDLFQPGQQVKYFLASQLTNYTYVTIWIFRDDGTIEPMLGFTGRLQVVKSGEQFAAFGSRLNPVSDPMPRIGLNHMHNVYWRLDLDLNGAPNDAIDRRTQAIFTGISPDGVDCSSTGTFGGVGGCRTNNNFRIRTESVERLGSFRTWTQIDTATFNAEQRTVGYEIIPKGNQIFNAPPSEPWASGELFVTVFNSCENFAVNNNLTSVNPGCGAAAPDVRAMVSGQRVNGADIVLWYKANFEHVTKDEDEINMPIEYVGLEIQPRNWRHVNTLQ